MFARRYFGARYFARRYFGGAGAAVQVAVGGSRTPGWAAGPLPPRRDRPERAPVEIVVDVVPGRVRMVAHDVEVIVERSNEKRRREENLLIRNVGPMVRAKDTICLTSDS